MDKLIFKGKYENAGGVLQKFSMAFCVMWPKVGSLLKMELFESQAVNFFASVIKNQIKDRKSTGQRRNDFIDALSQVIKPKTESSVAVITPKRIGLFKNLPLTSLCFDPFIGTG